MYTYFFSFATYVNQCSYHVCIGRYADTIDVNIFDSGRFVLLYPSICFATQKYIYIYICILYKDRRIRTLWWNVLRNREFRSRETRGEYVFYWKLFRFVVDKTEEKFDFTSRSLRCVQSHFATPHRCLHSVVSIYSWLLRPDNSSKSFVFF